MVTKKVKKAAASTRNVTETAVATLPVKKKVTRARKPKAPAVKSAAAAERALANNDSLDQNNYIVIDYPTQNETVSGLHYAIRIGASDTGSVEISFDNGDWQPCRPAAGYWWFDWGYFTPGTHKIAARLCNADGKLILKAPVVTVEVI